MNFIILHSLVQLSVTSISKLQMHNFQLMRAEVCSIVHLVFAANSQYLHVRGAGNFPVERAHPTPAFKINNSAKHIGGSLHDYMQFPPISYVYS